MGLVLAFVDIFVDSSTSSDEVTGELSKLPNVLESYKVKREFGIVTFVSAPSIEEFHDLLHNNIHNLHV